MRIRAAALVALVVLAALPSAASAADSRYSLAGGCYSLRSNDTGRYVAEQPDGRYAATASVPGAAQSFRMKATSLGSYLLYGGRASFLAKGAGGIVAARAPSAAANWRVDDAGPARFSMALPGRRKVLASSARGSLRLKSHAAAGAADDFSFESASGCARFPEANSAASGSPFRGSTAQGEVKGTLDAHAHITAFEFIGGDFHCGRPWSPYGIAVALPDCASIQGPRGSAAPVQNFLDYGQPVRPHDTVGYPTFKDWPAYHGLSYEGTYWKWVERAWQSGLRMMVTQLVDNDQLCEIFPRKRNSCDEMQSARLQRNDLYALQNYIDAQYGGPGKGFLRVVTDPFEARRQIARGKLAVVMGMETSSLFGCKEPTGCTQANVDAGLKEFRNLGVRSYFPVHKFDNGFGGTKMDGGALGAVINGGNKLQTGHYWDVKTCKDNDPDNTQLNPGDPGVISLLGTTPLGKLLPTGATPAYPAAPHCNQKGLSPLGHYLIGRMMKKHLILELDHMDAVSRRQALTQLEGKRYSGVISAHSWASPANFPRIYKLGGVVTPSASDATGFATEWKADRQMRSKRFYFGFGYGSDMNGLAVQGQPDPAHPVHYPFKSLDGKVSFNRQVTGKRTFDYNKDGVAQYGMYADWLQNLHLIAGNQISREMNRGAEAYLQMWERTDGIHATTCRARRARMTARGIGRERIGRGPVGTLHKAGQPSSRPGSLYRWCVKRSRGAVTAGFDRRGRVAFVGSTAARHRFGRVHPGARKRVLRHVRRVRSGVYIGPRGKKGRRRAYLVRHGRVKVVAIASRAVVRRRSSLTRLLRASARGRVSSLTPPGFATQAATRAAVAVVRHSALALCTL